MKNKHIRLIIIIYSITLIVGTLVYYIIPKSNVIKNSSKLEAKSQEDINIMTSIIDSLKTKGLDEKYKVESFEFNNETLEILLKNEIGLTFLNRKATGGNQIKIYSYNTPGLFEGVDISDRIKDPKVQLVGNKLTIEYEKQKFNYVEFPKGITITQFYKDEPSKGSTQYDGRVRTIIYIEIPKDLKVIGDEKYQYVNDYNK